MATRRKTKSKSKSRSRRKSKKKSFFKDQRVRFIIGLILILFAIYSFLAFLSYFFTWQSDFNKGNISFFEFLSSDVVVGNWMGRLGAALAVTFVHKFLGIGAFGLVFIVFLIGMRLINIRIKHFWKWILHASIITVLTSAFFTIFTFNDFFPLGGVYVRTTFLALKENIGGFGAVVTVLLLIIIYVFFAIDNSFEWTKKKVHNIAESEKIKEVAHASQGFFTRLKERVFSKQAQPTQAKDNETEPDETGFVDEQELNPFSKITDEYETPSKHFVIGDEDKQEIEFEIDLSSMRKKPEPEPMEMEVVTADSVQMDDIHQDFDPTKSLRTYRFPSIDLLEDHGDDINEQALLQELKAKKEKIIEVLKNFKIDIIKINAQVGPTVTLYEIVPAPGIPISKIKRLDEDIAMNLAALGIRIIAPMPGRGTIGIEVPNENPTIVSLKDVLLSPEYHNAKYELPIALGKDTVNKPFVFDLAKAPHVLMAGSTGEGKSVAINVIINSLIFKKHPALLKFVLIDPKQVELSLYSRLSKHYLATLPGADDPIVTDVDGAKNVLKSLIVEMEDRYRLLKLAHVRNIKEYNQKYIKRRLNDAEGHRFMPYIVTVIDEFADLIMVGGKEIEHSVTRLSQKARAIGIHLVVATQRPSTDVVTGLIKNNFPTRIALKVMSVGDSKTIIDTTGANQLIGKGDMLYLYGSHLHRLQCAFISTEEVDRITRVIEAQQGYPEPYELPEPPEEEGESKAPVEIKKLDKLFDQAAELVVSNQYASISLLQRKMEIGFNRAARIIDQLEAAGIVGHGQGSKPRDVLVHSLDELDEILAAFKKH